MRTYSYLLVPIIIIGQLSCQANHEQSLAEKIISKHKVVFDKPPTRIPVPHSVDAPMLGNGYTGVALSGKPEKQVY